MAETHYVDWMEITDNNPLTVCGQPSNEFDTASGWDGEPDREIVTCSHCKSWFARHQRMFCFSCATHVRRRVAHETAELNRLQKKYG